jgi:DNA replication and repair protein RecF
MIIKSIKLQNYRNYESLNLQFNKQTNIFHGDNGQGKTNLLEALYLTGTTKSHRGTKDKDIIQFDYDEGHIEIVVEKKGVNHVIDVHLKKYNSKGFAINKVPIKKASEYLGLVNFVFFSPEDLNIIKAGPLARRRFIDLELSQLDKIYLSNILNYNRVINQRNTLLREMHLNPKKKETLDIWDVHLIEYGKKIIATREEFIERINEIINGIHRKLTGGKENLKIIYEKNVSKSDFEKTVLKNREKDIRIKSTSIGPHRDDLSFISEGIDLRHFGSQGQQRTAALSLKMSEIELVKKEINDTPILLLDDVLSELDEKRQHYLLSSIRDIQTMITCTGLNELIEKYFSVNKVFKVHEGRISNVM